MKAYGYNRNAKYHPAPGERVDREAILKQAPRGLDSAKRKSARQGARSAINAEIFH
jgi:hypothetical protein